MADRSQQSLARLSLSLGLLLGLTLLAGVANWVGHSRGPTAVKDLTGCSVEGQRRGLRCPSEAGYYWCSTDRSDPVSVWNDGTADEPHWMVQHLSGQGDGYHALKYSQCRFSPRITNPFFPGQ